MYKFKAKEAAEAASLTTSFVRRDCRSTASKLEYTVVKSECH